MERNFNPPKLSIAKILIITAICVFLDVNILPLNIPAFGLFVLLPISIFFAIKSMYLIWKKHIDWKWHIAYPLSPIIGLILTFLIFSFNSYVGRSNAEKIIIAVETYKSKTGSYPKNLNELVPNYISKIPPCAYRFGRTNYDYQNAVLRYYPNQATRMFYNFENKDKSWPRADKWISEKAKEANKYELGGSTG